MRDQTTEVLDPVARLRGFIKEGGFVDGGRLPPERHLSDQLGLSRATLRKALDALERDGVIWRHVGKGTFGADGARREAEQARREWLGRGAAENAPRHRTGQGRDHLEGVRNPG